MSTNLNFAAARIPAFRNISSLKATPHVPVIPYFTRKQWEMATKGLRHKPLSRPDPNIPRLHYQPAPWGRGDIIVVPKDLLDDATCTPRVRVRIDYQSRAIQIELAMECRPPRTRYGCLAYFLVFPGKVDDRIFPVSCLNEDCRGQCEIVLEGAKTLGDVYCVCSRVV